MYECYFNAWAVHFVHFIIQNNKANNFGSSQLFYRVYFVIYYKHFDLLILLNCIILMISVTLSK